MPNRTPDRSPFRLVPILSFLVALSSLGCSSPDKAGDAGAPAVSASAPSGLGESASQVAQDRGLNPDDVVAALKTYTLSGKYDEYVMFGSGGHSGQARG